ncbi:MAG: tetratricopeptide repeat protein [Vibrio sp.]|uniref:tetratricopeptide repeat protein n=1 Tax=Vibrio sp. TaxID=678 RepID=UPI003A866437
MSVMNKALSQLAEKQQSSLEPRASLASIEKAQVEPMKTRPVWVWIIAGFGLSLAVGGWAVSQQETQVQATQATGQFVEQPMPVKVLVEPSVVVPSPTQKESQADVVVYRSTPIEKPLLSSSEVTEVTQIDDPAKSAKVSPPTVVTNKARSTSKPPVHQLPVHQQSVHEEAIRQQAVHQQEMQLASNASSQPQRSVAANRAEPAAETVMIEQVDMSAEKLAEKAISRATKAMDSNDFQTAVSAYGEALRYTPNNESVRQKLAALYYGKGEVRKAFDLMQRGIELNPEGESLRIALSKLLIKEQQTEAALTPLAYLPAKVSVEYLSLRAAVAQKVKQNEIALESYQKLTEKETNNGRWWLGLAIQQERSFLLEEAKASYQNALTKVGVSIQSQTFIRNRLDVLNHLEESSNAN